MQLTCPNCGTRDVRVSSPQGLVQNLKSLVGVSRMRCRRCSNRWQTSAWANRSWKYARCPRCFRQELTKWTAQYYSPTRWTRLLLKMGASPRRCPACRCNFASFRPQKEDFSWRHQVREPVPQMGSFGTEILTAEHTPPGEESGEQTP